jgi:hypothetical protein
LAVFFGAARGRSGAGGRFFELERGHQVPSVTTPIGTRRAGRVAESRMRAPIRRSHAATTHAAVMVGRWWAGAVCASEGGGAAQRGRGKWSKPPRPSAALAPNFERGALERAAPRPISDRARTARPAP